jgi:hypothetical protein
MSAAGPATVAASQDFRGGVTGTVTDKTGGVLPGVTISVTNTDTGVSQTTITNAEGLYQVFYLNAGPYSVTAELQGFKKVVRAANDVRVGDVLRVDLTMETGTLEETVTVTADAPMLNSTTGISGTSVTSKQIEQLPLGDGTAYMLTRLAPGIMDSSDLHFARPADNGNRRSSQRRAGRQRVHDRRRAEPVERARRRLLAALGRDRRVQGADQRVRRVRPHRGAVESRAQERHQCCARRGLVLNRDGSRTATPPDRGAGGEKPTREHNRYTGTVAARSSATRRSSGSFGTCATCSPSRPPSGATEMRRGDLSEFGTAIYDPLTATGTNGARTASQATDSGQPISPVAAAYAAFYPAPNRSTTESNYFTNQRPHDHNARMASITTSARRAGSSRRATTTNGARTATGPRTPATRPTAASSTASPSPRDSTTAATSV